jgi:hypothetical protein
MPLSDSDDELRNAMGAPPSPGSSFGTPPPVSSLGKRPRRHDDDNDSDTEALPSTVRQEHVQQHRVNQNFVMAAKKYATKKKLRGEQLTEVDTFANVSPYFPASNAKLC